MDYPMGSYIPKWKIFRAFTNENKTIAEHIVSTKLWQNTKINCILDIGTGDGQVLSTTLSISHKLPNKVVLVDPNSELLNEAKTQLSKNVGQTDVFLSNTDIGSVIPDIFQGVDFILLVHVLYLVPFSDVEKIINNLPINLPLLIITDKEDSLFPRCWKITAPKYFERSVKINAFLSNLPPSDFSVEISTFKTFIKNPYMIDRPELMNSILSLISYTEYENLNDNKKGQITEVVKDNSINDLISCETNCYEIIKKAHNI
ncbi:MAG: class I SAM-dependent methyltransferase [Bacteroidota bacterium]